MNEKQHIPFNFLIISLGDSLYIQLLLSMHPFFWLFILLFNKYLMNTYYGSDTI